MKRLRLPSLIQVGSALLEVFRRFPWTVFFALLGTGAAITLVELEHSRDAGTWLATRVLLSAFLGLPLTVAVALTVEARGLPVARRLVLEFVALAAVLSYFLSLPDTWEHASEAVFIRAGVLALGMHFVVAFAPFAGRALETEFWDSNWRLFLRFWLGALYSAVLFVGLVAALASASQLFDLKIRGERYFELWLIVAGLFNTCFFLHGTPREFGRTPEGAAYPRGLRMFAQFALAPLVVVYLAILYPYAAKIIWLRTWPNGWVSLPILCLAVAGILAALFLHPVREKADERWAAWYWTWFFRALFPLTVLLYLAVRVRVSEYGLTESRYFGFVLAGWLGWVSAYYWWRGNRSIRWLPGSLAALCLLTTWGPWGAFRASERSQLARLEQKLATHGLIVDGVLTPKPQTLEAKEYGDLQSMLRYLRSRHDSARLDHLLAPYHGRTGSKTGPATGREAPNAWVESEDVLTWLGVRGSVAGSRRFSLEIDANPGAIDGFARAGVVWNLNRWAKPAVRERPGWPRFELDRASGALMALTAGGRIGMPAVDELLAEVAKERRQGTAGERVPWSGMSVPVVIDGQDYLVVILQANGERPAGGRVRIDNLSLLILAR